MYESYYQNNIALGPLASQTLDSTAHPEVLEES